MTNGLSGSTNAHLVSIRDNLNITDNGELLDLYKLSKEEQQKELKKIFTVIADNTASAREKAALEAKAEVLLGKVDKLESRMKDLDEKISEKEDQINQKVNEVADLITQVGKESANMEDKHISWVNRCVSDVFDMYQRDPNSVGGKDGIVIEIQKRIENSPIDKSKVQKLLDRLDGNKSTIQSMVDEADGWMTEINTFKEQYGVTKSAFNLINRTINQIGNIGTTYTNSDYNTNIPVYSLEKTDIITDLFDSKKLNVLPTNTNYNGQSVINEGKITEKYQQYLKTGATSGVDSYSYNNKAVQNLEKAINKGLLDDLSASSMNKAQIAQFLGTNFKGANIIYNADNNSLNIPYGHGEEAQSVFGKVNTFIENINNNNRYVRNTWDKKQGNTIDSNEQIKALSKNYSSIIDNLAKGNPAFSFKEAMYALFDKDNGLFKNTGILYDKSKQGKNLNYTIDRAGDGATQKFYQNIAAKIKEAWGVDATFIDSAIGSNRTDMKYTGNDNSASITQNRTDPLTFRSGDSEYALIYDRNNDGGFSNMKDFVGATGDWKTDMLNLIDMYDSDKDGALTGDELKNIKMLKSDYTDNAAETRKDGKLHETKNNIGYKIVNATDLGIVSISKADIKNAQANNRAKDIHGNDKTDINNSAVFNDSITFKRADGSNVTFGRKDDTEEFMNTVYGDAAGKSFTLGLSESEADKEINIGYKGYNDLYNKHEKTFQNVNVLKKYNQAVDETKAMYNNTLDRMQGEEDALITKARNRAQKDTYISGWGTMLSEIKTLAAQKGILVDEEQMHGIYVLNAGIDAEGIIKKYQQQYGEYTKLEQEKNSRTIAWDALIKCFKSGINAKASDIKEILAEGKAKTADEIVKILKERDKAKQTE